MPHSVAPLGTVILSSFTPGTSANFNLNVTGAEQPQATGSGSIQVEFNGEIVVTPFNVEFNETVSPVASVVSSDPRVEVTFRSPLRPIGTTNAWTIPATLTVL